MFDTHMHTTPFSTDSCMEIAEVLRKQRQNGLGVVLTEHMDYEFPEPQVFAFDPAAYFSAYGPYRNDRFLLGVETGLQCSVREKNRALISTHPFDMVIGAIHVVCGRDLYGPSYFSLFSDKTSAYTTYLQTIYENIRDYDAFDTFAHMDYISRNAPYKDPILRYEDFSEQIDRILQLLAAQEKSLEINTRLFGNQQAVTALGTICSRFAELGGHTVTIGSDAHCCEHIGAYLEQAYQLASECGLLPVYYKERQAYPAI